MELDIQFCTQANNKYSGDCGMAMIAMLAMTTIKSAYNACEIQPGMWANFNQLSRGLKKFNIDSNYARLFTYEIKNYITMGWPIIALIDYGRLPEYLKNGDFDGAHFVLCTGFSKDEMLVHDPLGNESTGKYRAWHNSIFSEVHYRTPGNYNSNQCLVVQKSYRKPVVKITKKQRQDGRFNAL